MQPVQGEREESWHQRYARRLTIPSPIGQLFGSETRRVAAFVVATLVVVADFRLVWRGEHSYTGARALLPLIALATFLLLNRGDLASLGLVWRGRQGIRYWIKASGLIGGVVLAVVLVSAVAFVSLGAEIPIHGLPLSLVPTALVRMCVLAPIIEEATYRLALCTASASLLRSEQTIALSGVLFAFLHVLYGNPGPDNIVAGFFLAWAYLKSGSILTPILLHSLGNLCVLVFWVALWYGKTDWLWTV